MKILSRLTSVAIVLAIVPLADGHGTPIQLQVDETNKLVVSGGLPDSLGYAPMIFVQTGAAGTALDDEFIEPFGWLMPWDTPGFQISGMQDHSDLSIEVLRRPVKDSPTSEHRTLWYWKNSVDGVQPTPAAWDFHLLAGIHGSRTLSDDDTAAPPPLVLADPMTGQQGTHNHGLLTYAVDTEPAPPSGAIGFFARLSSTDYVPSDPFLVVFNHAVPFAQMESAAQAINAAAVLSIAGDYDGNGQVQPADYQFWRDRFGNLVAPATSPDGNANGAVDTADYVIWRNAFSQAAGGAALDFTVAPIPEPTALALASIGLLGITLPRRSPRSRRYRRNLV